MKLKSIIASPSMMRAEKNVNKWFDAKLPFGLFALVVGYHFVFAFPIKNLAKPKDFNSFYTRL